MLQLGGSDDRRGDDRLSQQPGERDLRPRQSPPARELRQARDNLLVVISGFRIQPAAEIVRLGSRTLVVPVPRETAAGKRAPGNYPDPFGRTQRQHLTLLLPIQQINEILHAHESRPTVTSAMASAWANCHAYIDDAPM